MRTGTGASGANSGQNLRVVASIGDEGDNRSPRRGRISARFLRFLTAHAPAARRTRCRPVRRHMRGKSPAAIEKRTGAHDADAFVLADPRRCGSALSRRRRQGTCRHRRRRQPSHLSGSLRLLNTRGIGDLATRPSTCTRLGAKLMTARAKSGTNSIDSRRSVITFDSDSRDHTRILARIRSVHPVATAQNITAMS